VKTIHILRTGSEDDGQPEFSSEQANLVAETYRKTESPNGVFQVLVLIAHQKENDTVWDLRLGSSGNMGFRTDADRAAFIKFLLGNAGEALEATRQALSGHAGIPRA